MVQVVKMTGAVGWISRMDQQALVPPIACDKSSDIISMEGVWGAKRRCENGNSDDFIIGFPHQCLTVDA